MQTLKNAWAKATKQPLTIRDTIIQECGKKISWFYDALANPSKLSPAEKAVFEKYLGKEIDWPDNVLLSE